MPDQSTSSAAGQMPGVQLPTPSSVPMPAAQPAPPGATVTPADNAQSVIANSYGNPHAMAEHFWQLKKATLKQTYGIDIKD